jgi:hypothetical protein
MSRILENEYFEKQFNAYSRKEKAIQRTHHEQRAKEDV